MQLDPEKLRQRLKPLFQENFDKRGELGAAVSVWQNGKPIVDLYGGFRDAGREKLWTADTVVLVWSATKGIGSACVLHALQQRKIELNWRVAEFWIGLPEEQNSRVATIYAAKSGKPSEPAQFYRDLVTPGTLARKTFTSPYGLNVIRKMNDPHIRAQSIVSLGGIGSASALAKFYSVFANGGELNGQSFFSQETIERMTTTLSDGKDRVFQIPTAFSAGFMKDSRDAARRLFGLSATSFGHPGAGGSHAFADAENKIAFAYVMNRMEQSVLPNEKSL